MSDEAKTYKQEIVKHELNTKDGSLWIETKNQKGEVKKKKVTDKRVIAQIAGLGMYELTYAKNGQYFDITNAKLVSPGSDTAPAGNGGNGSGAANGTNGNGNHGTPANGGQRLLDQNVEHQNRSIMTQVAVKASADIVVALIESGEMKTYLGNEKDKLVAVRDYTVDLAEKLMMLELDHAARLSGKREEKKPDPVGS